MKDSHSFRRGVAFVCVMAACWAFVIDIRALSGETQSTTAGPSIPSEGKRRESGIPGASDLLKVRLEQSYAIADFNADGLQDIALVDFLADSVKVMIADAAGRFRAAPTLAARRGARSIAAADFNQDGITDLAVAEFLSGGVHVFFGRGDGQFNSALIARVSEGISSLISRDLDGDTRTDIILANALSGAVLILKNAGGFFAEPVEIGRINASTVLFVDANGDGIQDIAAIDAQGNESHLFAGSGNGLFADPIPVDTVQILSTARAEVTRTMSSAPVLRLEKIAGDGVVQRAGIANPETVVIGVKDSSGATGAGDGQIVVFSTPGGVGQSRMTDRLGQASVSVALPVLPDVSVISAALPSEQVALFSIVSVLFDQEISGAIEDALAREVSDPMELADRVNLVRHASQRFADGDTAGGIRWLKAMLDQLPSEQADARDVAAMGTAADLTRRFMNQALLTGPVSAADNEPLVCDVPMVRTIADPTEIDKFSFACETGEIVHISLGKEAGASSFFSPQWRLIAPDGTPATVCGTWSGVGSRECTIPAAGAYAVEVSEAGFDFTGPYSIHLQRLTAAQRCTGSITCDAALSTTISNSADTDLHGFTGVAGEIVHISLGKEAGASSFFSPQWRLIAPDGTAATVCGTWSGVGSRECAIPAAGEYAVEVSEAGFDFTGPYSIHLQRLTAAQRCTGSITCDTALTATISNSADTDLHGFTGVAGEIVHISLGKEAGASSFFSPQWRLIAPDGTAATVCGTWSGVGSRECTIPAGGAYAVEVSEAGFDFTGPYSIHLQRLTAAQRCTGSITCDTALTATISNSADTDLHGFTGVAGEIVHISLGKEAGASSFFSPQWRLIAPDGTAATVCGTWSGVGSRECTIPAAGAYAVEVIEVGFDFTGPYSIHLQRLTAAQRCTGSITCDTALSTTISNSADTDLHGFTGVAGEIVHISLGKEAGASSFFSPQWRLIAPDGTAATVCGTWSGVGSRECTIPAAGAYAVEVSEAGFDFTGPYSLHLQRLTAAQRCSGSITCDAALSTTISNSADTDLHGFTGVAGEIVHISLGKEAGASSFFDPQWRLIAPDGTAATVCGTWSGVGSRECTIPAGGAYAVEVSEVGFDFTGPYSLHLQRLTAAQRCGGSITCGVAVQSAISNSADTDLHGFTGVANEIVHIGLAKGVGASSFFNPQWRLIAPDGTAAAVCGTWTGVGGFDCTLPSGGAYAVEVSEVGFDFTGPYVLTISGNGCTNNLPNLRVSTLAGKAVAGAGLAYSAKDTTLNAGTAPAPVSATKFFISLDATWDAGDTPLVPIAGRSVPTLAPGASSVGTTMVTIPAGTPPSRRYLIAYADGGSTVTESNETDNTKVKAIFVGPDLRVPTLTGPASATRGQTISVSDTTTNVGGAATIAATTTRIYLSKNTKVDAMDVPLGPGRSIPLLPAGAANTLATNVTIPSGTLPGAYYLVARADDGGVEAESRETNNTKALAITIN